MTIAFTIGRTTYRHFAVELREDGHTIHHCESADEACRLAYLGNLHLGFGRTYVGVGNSPA
jgi:hypothetical protein